MIRAAAALAVVALAGCPGDDCDGWASLADLDVVPLSVQGRSPTDVWIAGGGLGTSGGFARHWDGDRWTSIDPGVAGTLWWVWPGADGTTWMVGEHGTVVRVHGTDVTVDHVATDATLYGVWGASPSDVWLVGGVANGRADPEDDFIRHWDGNGFVTPPGVPVRNATLFKVWGASPTDVWISGEAGTMLRWNGSAFEDHSAELATFAPALTVHGCATDDVWAVAGQRLYAWDGATWTRRDDVTLGSVANGVSCGAGGVLVVGNAGLKLRFDRTTWHDERGDAPTAVDLHGAWMDDAGRAWTVGGNFNQPGAPTRTGVVGERGCPRPASVPR